MPARISTTLNASNTLTASPSDSQFKLVGNELLHSCPTATCPVVQYGTFNGEARILETQQGWVEVEVTDYGYFDTKSNTVKELATPIVTTGWLSSSLVPSM